MKFFFALFLVAILVFIGLQGYRLNSERMEIEERVLDLSAQASVLETENEKLKKDLIYYQSDYNLSKELKSKFNYRHPDEKMLILIPAENSIEE